MIERDTIRASFADIAERVKKEYQAQGARLEPIMLLMETIAKEDGLSELSEVLLYIHDILEDILIDEENALTLTTDISLPAKRNHIYQNTLAIARMSELNGQRRFAHAVLISAQAFSEWPPLICSRIWRFMRHNNGAIDRKFLDKLNVEWLKENLGTDDKDLIEIGLTDAYEFKHSGYTSQAAFAKAKGYHRNTLNRYLSWHKIFETQDERLPDELIGFMEQKIKEIIAKESALAQ